MPVSRKRKSRKSRTVRKQPAAGRLAVPTLPEVSSALAGVLVERERLDARRTEVAAELVTPIIAELAVLAAQRTDEELEEILCRRLGAAMWGTEKLPLGEEPSPETVGAAALTMAAGAVRSALDSAADVSMSWRVLSVVVGLLPYPLSEEADELVRALVDGPGRPLRLRAPDPKKLTGPALWTRDAYGSRFAIVAPFPTSGGGTRWYLWDVDACGHQAFTVHSAFYPGPDEALTAWREGVGETATGEVAFTPVDNPRLAAEVLYREDGILRIGGENEPQLAEYLRSRSLAEAVIETLGPPRSGRPELDAERAARKFIAWMRKHHTAPADLDELATELASSWSLDAPADLYGTCSPHRVALTVVHVRDYYQDDSAEELVALLPAWISWLAERNGTPSELVERCLPYASGEPYPGLPDAEGHPDDLARVTE
jgi:hypothetical protein